MDRRVRRVALGSVLIGLLAACGGGPSGGKEPQDRPWIDSFDLGKCTQATVGKNRYFIMEPGYQLVLASKSEQVVITVLDQTEKVNGIETRVVEEREFEGGRLKEVSRNFFTICREHGDVFYHGEDVDDYKDGRVVGHGGAWRAGVKGARPGLMMPAAPRVGFRHYQEIAPGTAMDRAEVVADDVTFESPAGEFRNCLKVEETTPLHPSEKSVKIYAPEVGLVFDDGLVLMDRGRGRTPPAAPLELKGDPGAAFSEVEIPPREMPPAVAEVVRKLYPTGRIHEVKRETHGGGKIVYAIEIFLGQQQYDLEVTPEGKVLRNQKE